MCSLKCDVTFVTPKEDRSNSLLFSYFPHLFTISLRFLRQDVCYPLLKIKGISLKNVPNIPRKTGKNEFSTKNKPRSVSIIEPPGTSVLKRTTN